MTSTSSGATVWETTARDKQLQQISKIPPEWILPPSSKKDRTRLVDLPRALGLLSPAELNITEERDATNIVQAIAQRQLSSEDVVRAFCKVCRSYTEVNVLAVKLIRTHGQRAAIAHQLVSSSQIVACLIRGSTPRALAD
jgi:hypothetical protein